MAKKASCRVKLGNLVELDCNGSDRKESTEDNLKRIYTENMVDLLRPRFSNVSQEDQLHSLVVEELPHNQASTTIVNSSLIKVKGTIDGLPAVFALDSGASSSIMNSGTVKNYNLKLNKSNLKVKTADGRIRFVEGVVGPCEIKIGNMPFQLEMMVLPQNSDWDVLLGLDYLKKSRSAIYFDEEKFVLGDGSIVLVVNNKEEPTEVNSVEFYRSEEELFPAFDWRDEFNNIHKEAFEFENYFFEKGTFLKKKNYSLEEKTFMDKYVNLDELIKKVKSKEVKGRPRIWLKPEGVPKFELVEFFKLLAEYDDLFANTLEDLECCSVNKFRILTDGSNPIYKHPYRRSPKENGIIKDEIENLLKNGFIRRSRSPWGSPSMLVPKPNNKHRLVVDYRELNKITKAHPFPLPRLNDIFDSLRDSEWFSVLDLKAGFHQVEVEKDSIEKTAFVVWCGHFEWLRLPFGLKNAPSEFCRLMYKILGDIPNVLVYIDDICVHTKTLSQHLTILKTVFERLRKAKLKINRAKCSWLAKKIKLLGHIIEKGVIKMDTEKIKAIINRKAPLNVKDVQVWLGSINFYRKFVSNLALHVRPLMDLINKKNKWKWEKEEQKAFDDVKRFLTSYPILRIPDFNRMFILDCDASEKAIGAILGQNDDNNDRYACEYESRVLRGAELNYTVTEKELLAVILGLTKFRVYLLGRKFKIYTDHVALQWIINLKDPIGRLYRWAVLIQQFDFEIVYKKGSSHTNADSLSRPVFSAEIVQDDYSKDIYRNKL